MSLKNYSTVCSSRISQPMNNIFEQLISYSYGWPGYIGTWSSNNIVSKIFAVKWSLLSTRAAPHAPVYPQFKSLPLGWSCRTLLTEFRNYFTILSVTIFMALCSGLAFLVWCFTWPGWTHLSIPVLPEYQEAVLVAVRGHRMTQSLVNKSRQGWCGVVHPFLNVSQLRWSGKNNFNNRQPELRSSTQSKLKPDTC